MYAAQSLGLGGGAERRLEVSYGVGIALRTVMEDSPAQSGGGQCGVEFKRAAEIGECRSGPREGFQGQCSVVIACGRGRAQGDACSKRSDGVVEVPELERT